MRRLTPLALLVALLIATLTSLSACAPQAAQLAATPTATLPAPTPTLSPPTAVPSPEATVTPALPSDAEIADQIGTLMGKLVDAGLFNGVVLVARDGKVLFSQGYGMADREKQIPITSSTQFYIGAITSQFTAAAIMILQQDGKLSVQDSICKYLPGCPDAWQAITIHQLLTHTAGFAAFSQPFADASPPVTSSDMLAKIKQLPLSTNRQSNFGYNVVGYILAGLIVEQVSVMPYGQFLQEKIFGPLEMVDSGYPYAGKQAAIGYYNASSPRPHPFEPTVLQGYGGVYSSAQDMLRWSQALYTDTLLTEASREAMFSVEAPIDQRIILPWAGGSNFAGYGYGAFVGSMQGHRVAVHPGDNYGFRTDFARFPDDGVTIIVLCNDESSPALTVREMVIGILFGAQ